jgi:hypothetical protein
MKMRSFVRCACVVGAAALSFATFASGVAVADPYTGQTFADASAHAGKVNRVAKVATATGSVLEISECIVTHWQESSARDSSGDPIQPREILLDLNCNAKVATAGTPGNSAATEQGRSQKRDERAAAKINTDPSVCQTSDEQLAYCRRVCKRTGLCEI